MKVIALIIFALISFNSFAAPKCSRDAQKQIDSILEQMSNEQDSIKRIDLEFEINQISYNFNDCRKKPMSRDLASIQPEEIIITE